MGSLGSASIFTTKIILRSKFSSAGGLFLINTLEMACTKNGRLKMQVEFIGFKFRCFMNYQSTSCDNNYSTHNF
jgi:hypothetical protein